MNYFIFIVVFNFLQEVPFKPNEEFEVKLDYEFRQRPAPDPNTVNLADSPKSFSSRSNTTVLPYLTLQVKVMALKEEKMKMHITTNKSSRPITRKVSVNAEVELDLGYTDDMVDRVTAHEYTLTFITSNKQSIDRILITVAEDGSFLVNGQKRGKF